MGAFDRRVVRAGQAMLIAAVMAGASLTAAPPPIQNGPVVTRANGSIPDAIAAAPKTEPSWVAWDVPMVPGDRDLCSWWSNDDVPVRGDVLESQPGGSIGPPSFTPAAGPVPLEAGSRLVILVRVVNGAPERLRMLRGDCPIDAGGRTIAWLSNVTPADSLRFLDDVATHAGGPVNDSERSLANATIPAIGLHDDPAADAILDRLSAPGMPDAARRSAALAFGADRGARGFAKVQAIIAAETDPTMRRSFVTALARTRQAGTADALLALARTDKDAGVRAEAVADYARVADGAALRNVLAIVGADPDDNVKRRAVTAIASLHDGVATPTLIDLARTSPSLVVRKAAVQALGRSDDARAQSFIAELVAK